MTSSRAIVDPTVSLAAYRAVRERTTDVLGAVDDGLAASTSVPGCPGWTVTELAAHMCGVCVDILEGNLDGVGTAPWADAQAERFAPLGLAGVLEHWNEVAPQVEALAPGFPPQPATQLVFDATTHEQDARGAVRAPGARDADALAVPLDFIGRLLDTRVRTEGLPALALRTPDGWASIAGEGAPAIELSGSAFDLFRSFGGRRALDQIRSLDWSGDPEPYLAVAFRDTPLCPPEHPLVE
jgi:uncharacterized protein (TIGR03083 family)